MSDPISGEWLAEIRDRAEHALAHSGKMGSPFGPARIDVDAAQVLDLLAEVERLASLTENPKCEHGMALDDLCKFADDIANS